MSSIEQSPEFQAQVHAYKQQFIQAERREHTVNTLKWELKVVAWGVWLGLAVCLGWVLA